MTIMNTNVSNILNSLVLREFNVRLADVTIDDLYDLFDLVESTYDLTVERNVNHRYVSNPFVFHADEPLTIHGQTMFDRYATAFVTLKSHVLDAIYSEIERRESALDNSQLRANLTRVTIERDHAIRRNAQLESTNAQLVRDNTRLANKLASARDIIVELTDELDRLQ